MQEIEKLKKRITELENQIKLMEEQGNRMRRDLDKAKAIQGNFLPLPIDTFPLVDFEYFYSQQFAIGGDFFDIYKIDDHCFGVYIADIAGTGVSASMLTIFLKENFDKKTKSPAEALNKLQAKFVQLALQEESYITIFAMVFDTKNHNFSFCNGGHNQRCLLKEKNTLLSISCAGKPVNNWDMKNDYVDHIGSFEKGDKLVLFTDGLTDTKNASGEFYGEQRMEDVVQNSPNSLRDMLNYVASNFIAFCGKERLSDDFTLLILDILA